jgi:hypothetical protein
MMRTSSRITPGRSGTGEVPSGSMVRDHHRELVLGGDGAARSTHRTVQTHPQRRTSSCSSQPNALPLQDETAVPEPYRYQTSFTPGEPGGGIPTLAPLGGGEPRIAVTAQHCFGALGVQLPERSWSGLVQLTAQLLEIRDARHAAVAPPPVHVEHTCPHVTGRGQQSKTSSPLSRRHTQADPGGAHHHRGSIRINTSRHGVITASAYDKTVPPRMLTRSDQLKARCLEIDSTNDAGGHGTRSTNHDR